MAEPDPTSMRKHSFETSCQFEIIQLCLLGCLHLSQLIRVFFTAQLIDSTNVMPHWLLDNMLGKSHAKHCTVSNHHRTSVGPLYRQDHQFHPPTHPVLRYRICLCFRWLCHSAVYPEIPSCGRALQIWYERGIQTGPTLPANRQMQSLLSIFAAPLGHLLR